MFAPFLLALLSTAAAPADTADGDARLNDICFVDAEHGWAAGDRGVIWHTDDGGKRWQRQPSGVECPLHAICFLDGRLGWAAGGFTHPYTHLSTGVLLSTRDGGQTWDRDPNLVLPALRRVGFFDPRRGWAVGCRSAMYPSGAFLTEDGGRSWRPLGGDSPAGWPAADFISPRAGLLAGHNGSAALVRGGQLEAVPADGFELRSFTRAKLLSPTQGWLVGEGGLVQQLGAADTKPPAGLPKAVRHFDFAALAVRGPNCWIAGSPGTRVFHTADAGRTWQSFPTGSVAPLRAIAFADDQHGWAAGELGTILATDDGGRTWRPQHSGGLRAAWLCIFADPDDVPLELIARLSGNEGYRTAVEVLGRRDIEVAPRDDVPLTDRLHEAVVGVGGSAADVAWRFPLRQAGLRVAPQQIVEAWDRVGDGHGQEEFRARIVRAIRTWRPDMVITHDARREDDDPLVPLVHQAVLQAVGEAADPGAFADQIAEAGLAPWRVRRVYAAVPPGARGAVELVTAQFAPALGRSLGDAAAEPWGLLRDRFLPSPRMLGFRPPGSNTAAAGADGRDFFSGLMIPPASESRWPLPPSPLDRRDLAENLARRRRQAQAIVALTEHRGGSAEQLLAQIDQLTSGLDPDGAGQLYYQLADHYYHSGRWPLAAETFEALIERYPQHALSPLALRWLVQYYASEEVAWRLGHDRSQQAKRLERAVALGRQIERTRFEWFTQPAVRFPLAAAYRGLGQVRQAQRLYQAQGRSDGRDAWWSCAQAELRLADPKGRPLKPCLECVRAESRPHLDGRLDDPVWQKAKPAPLRSAQADDGGWPAVVMLAYDAEFLYLAVDCRQPPEGNVSGTRRVPDTSQPDTSQPATSRPRDADLSAHDRVEVFLDIDRDFATYYHLAVDHRGWTFDRCWEDATWDPTWFVASRQEKGRWTAEAAIPLKELTGRPPQPHDVWAVGIQRVVPGVGFQSWTTPAAVAVLPDGFGYLVFQ